MVVLGGGAVSLKRGAPAPVPSKTVQLSYSSTDVVRCYTFQMRCLPDISGGGGGDEHQSRLSGDLGYMHEHGIGIARDLHLAKLHENYYTVESTNIATKITSQRKLLPN